MKISSLIPCYLSSSKFCKDYSSLSVLAKRRISSSDSSTLVVVPCTSCLVVLVEHTLGNLEAAGTDIARVVVVGTVALSLT